MNARFDGETFDEVLDGKRLASQLERIKKLMSDRRWRSLSSIARIIGGSEAGVSARLRDLRKPRFGSYIVQRQRVGETGLFVYRVWSDPTQQELFK